MHLRIRPRLPVRCYFLCLHMKTLCRTLQDSGTEGEGQPYYMDCNQKCTQTPKATHRSLSFMLFSVAIYIYNCHHIGVSINCSHQQFHVTLLDSNWQFMSKRKAHYGNQFHSLFVISLQKGDMMLQEANQCCLLLVHTYRTSFQFFMVKYMHCIVQEGLSCSGIQHLNHSSTVQKLRINRRDSSDAAVSTST